MFESLTSNQIGLITLFATITGLFVAVAIYRSSLARGELSSVRGNVIRRLEDLSSSKELQDETLSESERELIFNMNIQVVERDILKYQVTARYPEKVDLDFPLKALMVFEAQDILEKRVLFRQRCYQLIARIDQAYYHEINTASLSDRVKSCYFELAGAFFGISSVYMLMKILSFIYS